MGWGLPNRQRAVVLTLLAMILAVLAVRLAIRDTGYTGSTAGHRTPLVDERPMQTARALAPLAGTRDEQRLARQALRLADHAVNLAFADAMRDATSNRMEASPQTKELMAHVKRAEAQVSSDQELVEMLKQESGRGRGPTLEEQQQLDLLQAQLELDKDELEDARSDLQRSGADPLSRIQRQFARYQAAQQQNEAAPAAADNASANDGNGPLLAQIRALRDYRRRSALLAQAHDEALAIRESVQRKHDQAEQASDDTDGHPAGGGASPGSTKDDAVLALLRHLSEKQKTLSDMDKQIQDLQGLGDTYGSWAAAVGAAQKATLRGILRSVLLILAVALGVYLAHVLIHHHLFAGLMTDHRRLRTLRAVVRFAVQAAGVVLVLLIVFGVPAQTGTILGLAGAGLTVALKDFIVGFFGWFALMGKDGIRVGDWVEVEGVVGEVIEIGLLRTVILETGNWNDEGHPTGRKVSFNNSFAIEGHYFNFSTSGQWLWDELQILVPSASNPYPIIDSIEKLVQGETDKNSHQAEDEWRRVGDRGRMPSISAAPAINLRPTAAGVEVHVRYITRAQERYATRARLYQQIVGLLHQPRPETSAEARA